MTNATVGGLTADMTSNRSFGTLQSCRTTTLRKCAAAAFTKLLPALRCLTVSESPAVACRQGSDRRQFAHDPIEGSLALEADAGPVGERNCAALDPGIVGKPAEIAKYAGIGLRPAQAETGRDRERHLVAAMGKQRRAAPAMRGEHFDRGGVLSDAVSLRRVDLDHVAPGAKTAETNQVFDIGR